jgi:hypothetical protein
LLSHWFHFRIKNKKVLAFSFSRTYILIMNNSTLSQFRAIAAAMTTEPTNWQWIGPYMSQRMFGITEARAKAYAERHGGTAKEME